MSLLLGVDEHVADPLQAGQKFHFVRQRTIVLPAVVDHRRQSAQRNLAQLSRLPQITRHLGQRLDAQLAKLVDIVALGIQQHALGIDRDTTHGLTDERPASETQLAARILAGANDYGDGHASPTDTA